MSKKITKKSLQKTFPQHSINLWLIGIVILSISLGCSFGTKTEKPTTAGKRMTLADAKNSRDLISAMKTQDSVKDYVLTKVFNEEKSFVADGEIGKVTTEYWSGLNTINMNVIKFSSADKALQYIDDQETTQKVKGKTPARGKKTNGDPTLFFRDSDDIITFITCRQDFCYHFAQEAGSDPLTTMLATTDFFKEYDEKYLVANN